MPIVLTNGGAARLLRGKVPLLTSWRLAVFANNVMPTRDTLLADLDIAPARFQVGGTVTPLTTPSWPTPASTNAAGQQVMTSNLIDVIPALGRISVTFWGWALISPDNFLMMLARFSDQLPKIVDRQIPGTEFLFRIELAEESIP